MGRPHELFGDKMAEYLADADEGMTYLVLMATEVLEQAPADPIEYQKVLAGIAVRLIQINSSVRNAREIVAAQSKRRRRHDGRGVTCAWGQRNYGRCNCRSESGATHGTCLFLVHPAFIGGCRL